MQVGYKQEEIEMELSPVDLSIFFVGKPIFTGLY